METEQAIQLQKVNQELLATQDQQVVLTREIMAWEDEQIQSSEMKRLNEELLGEMLSNRVRGSETWHHIQQVQLEIQDYRDRVDKEILENIEALQQQKKQLILREDDLYEEQQRLKYSE